MIPAIGVVASAGMPGFLDYCREAERLGVNSIWIPETWTHDALTPVGALAVVTERVTIGTGIAQIGARTPAALAMSAISLHELSGGRFVLGLGTSGPQVVEGWHGVEFAKPVRRSREAIEIIRMILRGDRAEYEGDVHTLPRPGGAGRALRTGLGAVDVPIYVAALGPANLRLVGSRTDGWVGNTFFCETASVFLDEIAAGAASAGRSIDDIDLTIGVSCEITDDLDAASRRHAAGYAFTIGAMGSAKTNFYNQAFARQGFGADVAEVQRLWTSGDREAAAARVPDAIGRETNLLGPPDEIARRLRQYGAAGIDTLRISPMGSGLDEWVDGLGRLLDIAASAHDVGSESQ